MWWPYVIVAAMSFGGAWTLQDWRFGAKESERKDAVLVAEKENRKLDNRRLTSVLQADNAATIRTRSLLSDASNTRSNLERLREQSDIAQREARNSLETCIKRVDTFGVIFKESVSRYSALAEVADRHANDVQKLSDAWPVE